MSGFRLLPPRYLRALAFACLGLVLGSAAAKAQNAAIESGAALMLPDIVVSPTGFPTPPAEIGNSVTVITDDDIERKQERTLPEALQDVPGLNVVQTGGPGGAASVFIRGANSNHTKVLVDGIDVSDPSTPTGGFDFSQIPTWDIARIEVLRGPQSGLYGSDAIGGVVNIITKQGSGPALANGMVEGGSFGTFNQATGLSGSTERFNYDLNFVHLRTADQPVTPTELLGPGEARVDDFSSNRTFSSKLGAGITDNFSVSMVTRYTDTLTRNTGDDNFVFPNATQSSQAEHAFFTRGEGKLLSFDGALENSFGVAYTHYNRSNVDPLAAFPGETITFSGDRTKLNWQGLAHLGNERTVLLGLEDETDSFASAPTNASVRDRAGFAEFHTRIVERLYGTASVRVDDNSAFGRATTWRVAADYLVPVTDTKLKASYGTGFKAPSLFQLYGGTSANPALQPETSRGFDLGVEQPLLDSRLSLGSTYFHDNIHNLIDSGPFPIFQNLNVDSATTYGAESFIAYAPLDNLKFRADYTYTMATTTTGVPGDIPSGTLLRRPKQKVTLESTWTPIEKLSFTATLLYNSGWFDFTRDNATIFNASTPGYVLVNLTGAYAATDYATFFARINNLLNRTYQEPIGFQQPGLAVVGGIHLTWGGVSDPK